MLSQVPLLGLGRVGTLLRRVRRLGVVLVEVGGDRTLAVDHRRAGDHDWNRPPAGGVLEFGSGIALDRDLTDGVGEAGLGEPLAHQAKAHASRRAAFPGRSPPADDELAAALRPVIVVPVANASGASGGEPRSWCGAPG